MFHFLRGILTPVFLAEVLGNLSKQFSNDRDPRKMVASLAAKTDKLGTIPNVSHVDLIEGDLLGYPTEMSYRPIVGGGQRVTSATGETGWFFDMSPEERAIQKWRDGSFEEAEYERSRGWRLLANSFDVKPLTDLMSGVPDEIKRDVAQLKLRDYRNFTVASLTNKTYRFKNLSRVLSAFDIEGRKRSHIIKRWDHFGRPCISHFAPYAFFCLCVTMTSMWGIGRGIISARPTNFIDQQYLFYLPFCRVFVSQDKMHSQLADEFMDDSQLFIWGSDLKRGLREIVSYYEKHSAELKAIGSMSFAEYPPLELMTPIHDAYDKHSPGWRKYAATGPKPPITKEESDKIMARLKPMMDAIRKQGH